MTQTCRHCKEKFEFPPGSPECTNCWEVRRRFEDFIQSGGNRNWARNLIGETDRKVERMIIRATRTL